jgi:hypothetical protein
MPLTTYTAGEVLTAASLNSNFSFAALNSQTAVFNETQASGTAGGTFTSGSYVKRVLNTSLYNAITSCTLTSSVVSLPAGTYYFCGSAPAFECQAHQVRIANTTDNTFLYGDSSFTSSTVSMVTLSIIETVFTIAGTKNFELQHRCGTTKATNGLGLPTSFGTSEVYAQLQIVKIA